MANQQLACLKKVNMLNSKIMKEKENSTIHDLCRFWKYSSAWR